MSDNKKRDKIAKKLARQPTALVGKLASASDSAVKKATKPIILRTPTKWSSPTLALRTVTSKSGLGVYASSDAIFKGAVFGRDSLTVAEDLMYFRPKLVRIILLSLARFQGEQYNETREEEPGKIVHEHRTTVVDGRPITGITLEIFNKYSFRWGGDDKSITNYGSCDATPHFVRILVNYCNLYGRQLLLEEVTLRSGYKVSMLDVVENAVDWVDRHLRSSKSGLLEYHRTNPHGLENQVWKDSDEFYVHESGEMANHEQPIASIEVQGLAYDALTMAATLLPSRAKGWNKQAEKLRKRTIDLLWDEQREYFALGTDFSDSKKLRIIKTASANPASLLNSSFFDDMFHEKKLHYISSIVKKIMGDNFLTDAGIRSRALSEANLVNFWDYHGSYVSWPKETYDVAKGLRRQGFPLLAAELENRLLNIAKAMHAYPEFVYVDGRGRVLGMPQLAHGHGEIIDLSAPNHPERIQAWTVSAVVAINSKAKWLKKPKKIQPLPWQRDLEKDTLRNIPHMPLLKSVKELTARYPAYPYKLKGK
jgi:glycogen debranching enzyme